MLTLVVALLVALLLHTAIMVGITIVVWRSERFIRWFVRWSMKWYAVSVDEMTQNVEAVTEPLEKLMVKVSVECEDD